VLVIMAVGGGRGVPEFPGVLTISIKLSTRTKSPAESRWCTSELPRRNIFARACDMVGVTVSQDILFPWMIYQREYQ
jgi:hypothetical protein